MARVFVLLILAAIVECVGVALLSGGLKELNASPEFSGVQIIRLIRAGATNGKILTGVALEAVFFGVLCYLLAKKDVSFVWPLTSLGFIITTFAAYFLLHEKVSPARWAGVLLIALGAGLIGYSEAVKKPAPPPPSGPATASNSASATLGAQ